MITIRGIKFKPNQRIEMECEKKETLTLSLYYAIELCKAHDIEIDLYRNGFLFGLDKESDLNDMVKQYVNWERMQK